MSANGINYAAVLADLEAKRAQLDSAIAAIKALMEQSEAMAATAPPIPPASLRSRPAFFSASVSLRRHGCCWK